MAYSNGRIYVDTSVTPNVGVSIGDLQRCFAVVIKATINGQTVRRLSGDLGVIVSRRLNGESQEKYFTVDGVQWEVESRADFNPWARYRPIPCSESANNIPQPLNDQQRLQEVYGIKPVIDMYTADDHQQAIDHANHVWNGSFDLQLRGFGNDHWKRLTDFVKTNDNGTAAGNVGYDHNAQPDNVTVVIGNNRYNIEPLIPEGQRDIYAPKGRTVRFQFPNDQLWVDEYYKYTLGQTSSVTSIVRHAEWLAPMDLMGMNKYKPNSIANVLRGVYIMKMESGSWTYVNRVWNTINKGTYSTTEKNTFLDLTMLNDGGLNDIDLYMWNNYPSIEIDNNAEYGVHAYRNSASGSDSYTRDKAHFLWNLEGEYLFIEFWKEANNSQNIMPIPGLCYTVHIYRNQIPSDTVDVPGVVEFLGVAAISNYIYLSFRVDETTWSDYSQNVWNLLKGKYSVLTTSTNVNNVSKNETIDILTQLNAGSFNYISSADGYKNYSVVIGLINDDYDPSTEPDWTATITARQTGESSNHSKTFVIDRSSLSE